MSEYIMECNLDVQVGEYAYKRKAEIVRCKDCKHYEYWEFRDGRIAHDCVRGGDYLFDTEPDGFCAWGKRREIK